MYRFSDISNIVALMLLMTFFTCSKTDTEDDEKESASDIENFGGPFSQVTSTTCSPPLGTRISDNGWFLYGAVPVKISKTESGSFNLYVQWLKKDELGEWTNTSIGIYNNGITPCQAFINVSGMWQEFYQDMVDAKIHPEAIKKYLSSISYTTPERKEAGVYVYPDVSGGGYAGAVGTITHGAGSNSDFKKYFLPHENTHGFQWDVTSHDTKENVDFYRLFATYTNSVYHQSLNDDSVFVDENKKWSIGIDDYAMQNDAEWFAEVFRGYIYEDFQGHWGYIKKNHPKLVIFFDCVWKEGKGFPYCIEKSDALEVEFAETVPVVDFPQITGFSKEESIAIWSTCFDLESRQSLKTTFETGLKKLVPSYSTTAKDYQLGFGDCNHDGVIDWVCSYKGLAPDGKEYLWNAENKIGMYTFIISGKNGDSYIEAKQDPFTTENGHNTLLQPMYREWKGAYGSCNGVYYFNQMPDRFPSFAKDVDNLPAELNDKIDWGSSR